MGLLLGLPRARHVYIFETAVDRIALLLINSASGLPVVVEFGVDWCVWLRLIHAYGLAHLIAALLIHSASGLPVRVELMIVLLLLLLLLPLLIVLKVKLSRSLAGADAHV